MAGTGEITGQSLSDLDITITGTDLPTTSLSVIFGGAPCSTVSGDDSSLTCTLEYAPFGGDHDVELYDEFGLVLLADGLA